MSTMQHVKDINAFIEAGYQEHIKKIILKKYRNVLNFYEIDEVVNECICQMIKQKTIEKFQPNKGVKFSSYIYTCLHNHIIYLITRTTRVMGDTLSYSDSEMEYLIDFNNSYRESTEVDIDTAYIRKALPNDRMRDIFDKLVKGYSLTDIGKHYGYTTSWAQTEKKNIRHYLEKYSYSP